MLCLCIQKPVKLSWCLYRLSGLLLTSVGSLGVVSLCRGPRPGTHHTQETGPGPEIHIKHTGNTHRKPWLNPLCRSRKLLHPALLSSGSQRRAGRQSPAAHSADNLSNFSAACTVSRPPPGPLTPHPPRDPSPDSKPWGFQKAGVRAESPSPS